MTKFESVTKRLQWLLLCCGLMLFCSAASACKKTINIGVVADWPPLTVFDQHGPWGLDVEIAELVFQHITFCTNYIRLPSSARTFEEMSKGVIDVALMTSYTKQREQYGDFTRPYRFERMRLFSLRPAVEITSLENLLKQQKSIGLSIGSYYGEELKRLKQVEAYRDSFVSIASAKSRVEMLMKGRVDFIVDDVITGSYFINELGNQEAQVWPYVVHDNQVHMLLRKGTFNQLEQARINDAIGQLKPQIELLVKSYRSDGHFRGNSPPP